MPEISTCLWFDDNLVEAVEFYTRVFPNSAVTGVSRDDHGRVLAVEWTLDGRAFRGINGGPVHAGFTETISLSVSCADQSEVDYYWDTLVDGGRAGSCAWLEDRFGLSWQIVPTRLYELVSDADAARARAAIAALMRMQKVVIADLEAAADAASVA
ncbi:VOC family protein [Nocardioides sp. YIM 152315]|uniref:VOC family protein n=1 Tax=Nocardioides sp. YIM 152315 TaxID=3031760 RepID=UPI0023D9F6BC|nr:VOC family protein [Nocardioides sp. YIM 152315]MDF1604204.1 VOC family protein [Nocardioides sp. YIM 152315]